MKPCYEIISYQSTQTAVYFWRMNGMPTRILPLLFSSFPLVTITGSSSMQPERYTYHFGSAGEPECSTMIHGGRRLKMMHHLVIASIISIFLNGRIVISHPVVATKSHIGSLSRVLKSVDQEADPCDDFYKFACGGFEKSTSIPDDKIQVNLISIGKDELRDKLRLSLEEPSTSDELRTFKLAKNLYRSCMNTSAIEKTGSSKLRSILKVIGEWPVLEGDNWKDDRVSSGGGSQNFLEFGYLSDYLVALNRGAGSDANLEVNLFESSLPRDYLIEGMKNKIVKAYFDFMVDIAVSLGAEEKRTAEELKESLDFETKLANISWHKEKQKKLDLLNDRITISEVNKRYPSTPEEVKEIMENTSARTVQNYVQWRYVEYFIKYLTKDLRAKEMKFRSVLLGGRKREDRWEECLDIVSESLPVGIGALYVRNHFNPETKKKAEEMMSYIRTEFVEMLKQASWMDEVTRTKALEKAASMAVYIAHPQELLDDEKLEEYHASLELEPDNLLRNALNLLVFKWKNQKNKTNETNWTSHGSSAVINAMYMPHENSIVVPAGILQGVFFGDDRPRYMDYGVIGATMGHEITHGFDTKGSMYDKNGHLRNWWNPETEVKYLENAVCMVQQYENHTTESVGSRLDGFRTLGENIADNGGVKSAYLAYKKWAKMNGPEPRLPGLDYTPEQMFWISAANTWCTKYRPEALDFRIKTDVHSPGRFRINIPFSNRPEFAADFNCPLGSTMNPVNKCSVW